MVTFLSLFLLLLTSWLRVGTFSIAGGQVTLRVEILRFPQGSQKGTFCSADQIMSVLIKNGNVFPSHLE